MEIPPLILQTLGSLLAILALFGVTKWLQLGGDPKLGDEVSVMRVADEVVAGFNPNRISIARDRTAALARNDHGEVMVIKRHGNRFAGRVLTSSATVREEVDALIVDPKEIQFGTVRLCLDDASTWADIINRL